IGPGLEALGGAEIQAHLGFIDQRQARPILGLAVGIRRRPDPVEGFGRARLYFAPGNFTVDEDAAEVKQAGEVIKLVDTGLPFAMKRPKKEAPLYMFSPEKASPFQLARSGAG